MPYVESKGGIIIHYGAVGRSTGGFYTGSSRWGIYWDKDIDKYFIASSFVDAPNGVREVDWFYADDKKDALRKGEPLVEKHMRERKEKGT